MSPGATLALPHGGVLASARHGDPSSGQARRAFDGEPDLPPRKRDREASDEPAAVEVRSLSTDVLAPTYGPYLTAWSAVLIEASKGGFLDVRA